MRAAVAFVMLVRLAAPAHAGPAADREEPPVRAAKPLVAVPVPPDTAPEEEPDSRSPRAALALSVAGAVVGSAAAVGGWAEGFDQHVGASAGLLAVASIAPSAGEWYAGRILTPGLALRAVGAVALGYLGVEMGCTIGVAGHQFSEGEPCPVSRLGGAGHEEALLAIGAGSYVAGAIWDVANARDTARAYNRAHARASVSPVVLRGPAGLAPGFAIAATF
ncbi:MAG: hypothetical protein ACM31C_26125 [Acidobacteriota bacterium]